VTVRNVGGSARAEVRVTANGVEMTAKTLYLSEETTVPVGVFGAPDEAEMRYEVEVVYPELPLLPESDSRIVRVD